MVLGYKLFQDVILVLQLEKLKVVFHMSLINDLFRLKIWETESPLFCYFFTVACVYSWCAESIKVE
ncbi:hypothetical protein PanWU01x14_041440 [Parasponia andersonii]|uniref:Uncharacterized protein n=1 Tax=Parasponia andersonii TaxID=3476 RepID=A0A2P5DQI2_PARAD|nr:hypothetical protein PanWU01x14_041440 [Parasponia andersonii]